MIYYVLLPQKRLFSPPLKMSDFDAFEPLNNILSQYGVTQTSSLLPNKVYEIIRQQNWLRDLWFRPEVQIYGLSR